MRRTLSTTSTIAAMPASSPQPFHPDVEASTCVTPAMSTVVRCQSRNSTTRKASAEPSNTSVDAPFSVLAFTAASFVPTSVARSVWPSPPGVRWSGRGELRVLDDADHVPFRVGDQGERDHVRDLGHSDDGLAAELLRLVEVRLRVVDAHVERHVPVAVVGLADPAADAGLF